MISISGAYIIKRGGIIEKEELMARLIIENKCIPFITIKNDKENKVAIIFSETPIKNRYLDLTFSQIERIIESKGTLTFHYDIRHFDRKRHGDLVSKFTMIEIV